jgi:aerobic-type carbon monoxide dehydrogenase small subunit (CoxS/CutS family)
MQQLGPSKVPLMLTINGRKQALEVEPRRTLAEALRVDLGLTGTKVACEMGNCGVCTVLVDGVPVYSCLTLALDCAGKSISTVEGLSDCGTLHSLQEAFIREDALQCGFCTPGQLMAAYALLQRTPHPTEQEVVEGMSGNLCRCGAYPGIVRAVLSAAK